MPIPTTPNTPDDVRVPTTYTDQLPTPRIHQDPWMLLRAIAELLKPCDPPEISAGWDRCAHAELWPCPVTRAWRIARTAYDHPDHRHRTGGHDHRDSHKPPTTEPTEQRTGTTESPEQPITKESQ
jgi:hypothetical protein